MPHRLKRRSLLVAAAAGGGLGALDALAQAVRELPADAEASAAPARRQPSIFVGHGSPMNAIQDNRFTRTLAGWGRELGRPRAIAVVSAHWLTPGSTQVSTTARPETIHDFGGFPAPLHAMRYAAPGAPGVARHTAARLGPRAIGLDDGRGLDHGAWTVLRHLYPAADVPVYQVSIDYDRPAAFHLAVGRALGALRDEGVLVLGSGNIVHNLGATDRSAGETERATALWAARFDAHAKLALDAGDTAALLAWERLGGDAARMAVPTPDHYFPLLHALGAARPDERVRHVFEGFHSGTLSMRCLQWG